MDLNIGNGSYPNVPLDVLAKLADQLRVTLASHRAELRRAGISFPAEILLKTDRLIDSIHRLDESLAELEIERKNLEALVQIGQVINSSLNPTIVLNEVVDTIIRLTGAERAFIMLRDRDEEMATVVARNWERESLRPDEYELSQSIIGQVLEGAEAIVTTNAQNDPRFGNQASVITYSLRSILCVPMIVRGETIGVIYTDNRVREGLFTEKEGQLLFAFANQAGIAIDNARLYDTIRSHADDLEERVDERTLELAEANQTLRELSALKDEFVSNVSHELRTPISSLKLYGSLIETPNEKFPQYVSAVQREINRLEHIIESLLRLSSLDQDQLTVYLAPTDLNKFIESLANDRRILAEDRNLELEIITDPALPLAIADQGLLTEAVSILLTNALNYTPPGGSIRISTETRERDSEQWLVIHVADSGPGIPNDEGPRLFQRFFRGRIGRESGYPGTGLGLSIVKEIVERNRGTVEANDGGINGEGATFSIWLPLTPEGR